jgi:hypothetical protein
MMLVKVPEPLPSNDFWSPTVGFPSRFQHTPLEVIGPDPTVTIFPPLTALVAEIPVVSRVRITGGTEFKFGSGSLSQPEMTATSKQAIIPVGIIDEYLVAWFTVSMVYLNHFKFTTIKGNGFNDFTLFINYIDIRLVLLRGVVIIYCHYA